jgi:hypothetical protein
MSNEIQNYDPNGLLDAVMEKHGLKNDAALAHFLKVAPPLVSKARHKRMPVGSSLILKCIEIGGMTLQEIRGFVGGRA